jgi:hypothetical protein
MFETLKKMWLNKKIISISNGFQSNPEDQSLSIGTIVDIIPISRAKTPVPLVVFESTNEPMICLSTLLEFDQKLYDVLIKMTAEERWLLIQSFVNRFNTAGHE